MLLEEGPQAAPSFGRGLRASLWAVVLEPVALKALVSTFLETDGSHDRCSVISHYYLPVDISSGHSNHL